MADTPGADDLGARLDALRASGAAERDPVRLAHLEALARRAAAQPAAIRQPLCARLDALAAELADSLAGEASPPRSVDQAASTSPLADLLAYIGQQAHASGHAGQPIDILPTVGHAAQPNTKKAPAAPSTRAPELKAIAIFRDDWSRLSTEQQLTQTLAQAPENAGPMNSQHLVLRSLQVMRDIAPAYLQGFMSYVDTLIWLEQADPTRAAAGRSSAGDSEKKPRAAKRGTAKR